MLKTAVVPYARKLTIAGIVGLVIARLVRIRQAHRHQPFYRRVVAH